MPWEGRFSSKVSNTGMLDANERIVKMMKWKGGEIGIEIRLSTRRNYVIYVGPKSDYLRSAEVNIGAEYLIP